ncbi:AI-2E family transporter [Frondihabitans cladoniiphilus]|uniref:AI-2E family transporter n=1 Tax=Frondihabitans cladoniiphilus TaxID=715785 RepID=A0ABP8VTK2_9MICO
MLSPDRGADAPPSAQSPAPSSWRADDSVPQPVRIAAAWAWRIVAFAAVGFLFVYLVVHLAVIVIPLMVALLLSALLVPLSAFLQRHRWPKWLAIVSAIVAVLVVLAGLSVLVTTQIQHGLPELLKQSDESYRAVRHYLHGAPFHLSTHQLTGYYRDAVQAVQSNSGTLVSSAVSFGSSFGRFVTGLLLTVFATIILLIDGGGVWRWTVRLFPRKARAAVDGAGRAGWLTLTTFVKVQIFVAVVNAVGIGVVAEILRIPLAIPLAVAVFLGSFIPVVGAVVTGAIAVFVALLYNGPFVALLMLAGVLAVHLLEGHVLQPLVMGSAVRVHPLAVVFAVAAGAYLADVPGALFAVPVVATVNVMVKSVASGHWRENPSPADDDVVPRRSAAPEGETSNV